MFIYTVGVLVVIFSYGLLFPYIGEEPLPIAVMIMLCGVFLGYFSGFFQANNRYKVLLILAGGAAAWLIP
jgi:hypothetical protein